jgi:uncharacterized membrane protein
MTRVQFILELTDRLKKLPKADREKAVQYYLELIDDRIDDGMPEEEAVAALQGLGFTRSESVQAVKRARENGATTVEEVIMKALQGGI